VLDAEIVGAPETPYAGGVFRLCVTIPPEYPLKPPGVRFVTKIYHPNIDTQGRICLDTLNMPPKGAWKPSLNVATVLASVQLLISHPNPDDGLMADITDEFKRFPERFHATALDWTARYACEPALRASSHDVKAPAPPTSRSSDDDVAPAEHARLFAQPVTTTKQTVSALPPSPAAVSPSSGSAPPAVAGTALSPATAAWSALTVTHARTNALDLKPGTPSVSPPVSPYPFISPPRSASRRLAAAANALSAPSTRSRSNKRAADDPNALTVKNAGAVDIFRVPTTNSRKTTEAMKALDLSSRGAVDDSSDEGSGDEVIRKRAPNHKTKKSQLSLAPDARDVGTTEEPEDVIDLDGEGDDDVAIAVVTRDVVAPRNIMAKVKVKSKLKARSPRKRKGDPDVDSDDDLDFDASKVVADAAKRPKSRSVTPREPEVSDKPSRLKRRRRQPL
jgi:ubiquitin-conjugating enzyme E2 T